MNKNSAPQNDESQNVARIYWDGEGHPPAGVVCEITTNDGHNWRLVKIIFFDDYVTMVGQADGKVNRELFKRCDADVAFRPIRTPEQIAANERESGIQALKQVFDSCSDDLMPTSNKYLDTLFGAIYDAGWRKP